MSVGRAVEGEIDLCSDEEDIELLFGLLEVRSDESEGLVWFVLQEEGLGGDGVGNFWAELEICVKSAELVEGFGLRLGITGCLSRS